jgi:hypothetical protein
MASSGRRLATAVLLTGDEAVGIVSTARGSISKPAVE